MKFDLDIMYTAVLALLMLLVTILFAEIKDLQTQVKELEIIVNQKFLPAMIFDKTDFELR
jgi:hypothetical protein